jgi:pyruvate ferredoxin oxidoreductase beta subunit
MWEDRPKKDMMGIVMAHGIPYAATACISYPMDYMEKIHKAIKAQGPAYIQVLAPCPPGWGYETDQTVEVGRLAVQTGFWALAEYEEGEFRITHRQSKLKPVGEYLGKQGRFAHLGVDDIDAIQADVEARWKKMP